MTDIEWGAEIAVNGVQPEWLRNQDDVRDVDPSWHTNGEVRKADGWYWPKMKAIRLPANHSYYLATSRGFTYWPGGESAPDDWDGGDCLDCDGNMLSARNVWDSDWPRRTVIGYRKRTEQPTPAIAPELVERAFALIRDIANLETFHGVEARAIMAKLEPDPDLTLAKSIMGDAEAIALAIKAARENAK